jgi:uncharacterized protein (DUF934 family)
MRFIDPSRDEWTSTADATVTPGRGPVLLSWEQWQSVRHDRPTESRLGVVVPNAVDVADLRADLSRLALVVLQFPKWTDGRAYSQARLLRARLRFGGEIRAAGQVLVDMLPLLQRSGFDAVQLRDDQSLESAQRALRFFASHYQGDVLEPRPLFARQAA